MEKFEKPRAAIGGWRLAAQARGGWRLAVRRSREREHPGRLAEGAAEIVGNGPAMGGDFEDFAGGVGEIEEDFRGCVGIALEADAVVDLLGGRVAVLGTGFQGAENGTQGERRRRSFVFGVVVGGEPVAKIGRAEGEDATGINAGGDGGAGFAALGEEGSGGAGVVQKCQRLIGLVEALGHEFGLRVVRKSGVLRFALREIVGVTREIFRAGWSSSSMMSLAEKGQMMLA